MTVNGKPEAPDAEMVSGQLLFVLGVQPQLGRGIEASDDGALGSGRVVVISDRFWTTEFGRAADVVGKTMLREYDADDHGGREPAGGFTGAYSAQGTPDIFLPFSMQPIVAPKNLDRVSTSPLLPTRMIGGCW